MVDKSFLQGCATHGRSNLKWANPGLFIIYIRPFHMTQL